MFLTKTDLHSLTHLERPKAQARWLRARGIPFEERNDGTLVVLRAAVEAKLGGMSDRAVRSKQPNWDAVNGARKAS